jgi:light-regulated signal transduction histidine kinase (bacteriophytochrome)
MTSDLGMLNQLIWSYVRITLGILAGAFVIAFLVTSTFARTITRPIMGLADAARLVSERGDFSLRAPVLGKDETGVLANAMNQMLEQIQEREAREHQAKEEIRKLNEELEERVRIRTTQLEVANKELEAFSYSVSHDLRAPLRHIDGFTQLLQKDLEGKLDSNAQRLLDVISTSAKTLGEMIDNLLVFSRMGKAELRKATLDMNALVLEVLREIENESRSARVDMASAPLPAIEGDRAMLKLVWTNLLLNAFKYTRTRPAPSVEIGWRQEGRENLFYVRDNGVGFDMRYVGKLFGVFERLHAADEFEGTGIGLANVKRIILRHEGRVWAEGAVDSGATFYFTLPQSR